MAAALTARGRQVEVICLSDRLDHDDSNYPFTVRRISRSLFFPWRILVTTISIWRAALRHDLLFVNGLGAEAACAALLTGRPTVYKIVGDYAWERACGTGLFSGTLEEYQVTSKGLALRFFDAVRTLPQILARQIIVPSQYLARIVASWGVRREKIRVIYNAVARDSHAADLPPALPPWSGKTLITVCRLVSWKGVDGIIRLLADLPNTRLIVAGDGAERSALTALAKSCGVADRVVFLGDVPHREVAEQLSRADAFVLNSTYEGLPHVVLEAMAAGIPVVATDTGGTGEVVIHERTGLLIPLGDAQALRDAVQRLWREPELGPRLAAAAADHIAQRFVFDAMLAATDATLRDVTTSGSRSQSPASTAWPVAAD
jgi:glycosyltransferase involved in cell wall biosynthesis